MGEVRDISLKDIVIESRLFGTNPLGILVLAIGGVAIAATATLMLMIPESILPQRERSTKNPFGIHTKEEISEKGFLGELGDALRGEAPKEPVEKGEEKEAEKPPIQIPPVPDAINLSTDPIDHIGPFVAAAAQNAGVLTVRARPKFLSETQSSFFDLDEWVANEWAQVELHSWSAWMTSPFAGGIPDKNNLIVVAEWKNPDPDRAGAFEQDQLERLWKFLHGQFLFTVAPIKFKDGFPRNMDDQKSWLDARGEERRQAEEAGDIQKSAEGGGGVPFSVATSSRSAFKIVW